MDSENYVLNHQYGYGFENGNKTLNKLDLRNLQDLKIYINDILTEVWGGENNGEEVKLINGEKIKVVTTLIKA